MAAVVVLCSDLLFGSRVQAALSAGGHDVRLVGDADAGCAELSASPADVLVVDLTVSDVDPAAVLEQLLPRPAHTLAFYSHVDIDVRERAVAAGFEQVVPRSRMAREGAELVSRLYG